MKTIINVAQSNKTFPLCRAILFSGNTAFAAGMEGTMRYAVTQGAWNFPTPRLVDSTLVKAALSLSKNAKWEGESLNGVLMTAITGDIENFPKFPEPGSDIVTIKSDCLNAHIERVLPAAAKQVIRYYLNGVLFDFRNGVVLATDGHRMHIVRDALEKLDIDDVILPLEIFAVKPTAFHFTKTQTKRMVKEVEVVDTVTWIAAEHSGGVMVMKAIDGKYPDWKRVLPKIEDMVSHIPITDEVIDAVKNMRKLQGALGNKFPAVTLRASGFAVTKHEDKVVMSSTAFKQVGVPVEISVNVEYLLQAITGHQGGNIQLKNGNDALVIDDGAFTAVVMPMRV